MVETRTDIESIKVALDLQVDSPTQANNVFKIKTDVDSTVKDPEREVKLDSTWSLGIQRKGSNQLVTLDLGSGDTILFNDKTKKYTLQTNILSRDSNVNPNEVRSLNVPYIPLTLPMRFYTNTRSRNALDNFDMLSLNDIDSFKIVSKPYTRETFTVSGSICILMMVVYILFVGFYVSQVQVLSIPPSTRTAFAKDWKSQPLLPQDWKQYKIDHWMALPVIILALYLCTTTLSSTIQRNAVVSYLQSIVGDWRIIPLVVIWFIGFVSTVQGDMTSMVVLMFISLIVLNIFARVFMELGSVNNTAAGLNVLLGGLLLSGSYVYYTYYHEYSKPTTQSHKTPIQDISQEISNKTAECIKPFDAFKNNHVEFSNHLKEILDVVPHEQISSNGVTDDVKGSSRYEEVRVKVKVCPLFTQLRKDSNDRNELFDSKEFSVKVLINRSNKIMKLHPDSTNKLRRLCIRYAQFIYERENRPSTVISPAKLSVNKRSLTKVPLNIIIGFVVLVLVLLSVFLTTSIRDFVMFVIPYFSALILLQYYVLYSSGVYSGKSGWVDYLKQFDVAVLFKLILLYSVYSILVYDGWKNRGVMVNQQDDLVNISETLIINIYMIVIFLSWWFLQYSWSLITKTTTEPSAVTIARNTIVKLIGMFIVTILAVLLIDTLYTMSSGLLKEYFSVVVIGIIILSFILFIWNRGSMNVVYGVYSTVIFLIVAQLFYGIKATMDEGTDWVDPLSITLIFGLFVTAVYISRYMSPSDDNLNILTSNIHIVQSPRVNV